MDTRTHRTPYDTVAGGRCMISIEKRASHVKHKNGFGSFFSEKIRVLFGWGGMGVWADALESAKTGLPRRSFSEDGSMVNNN